MNYKLLPVIAISLLLTACDSPPDKTVEKAKDAVVDASHKVADTAKEAGQKIVDSSKEAGQAVVDTAKETGQKIADKSKEMVGADKDEHGCIASAGYTWCAKTNQCERPWELAEKAGFDNTDELFKAYCSAP